jgi:hypothetical protein
VLGVGKISITQDHAITNILHVDSLSYNLLSVSQLCEMGYDCHFTDKGVTAIRREDSSIAFTGRMKSKFYLVDFNKSEAKLENFLVAKSNMGWLWHHRLAHVGMRNLAKLLKDEHILGLTNVHFEKDRICKVCQAGKQVGVPVAEPPKLYGPYAPVIVPKTSDSYACTPDNLRRSIGCLRRTPIQLRLTTHIRINKGVTTILQHLL